MKWTSIAGAIKMAAASQSSLAVAKIDVITACAQGLIQTRWRGHHLGSNPPIHRKQWAGADVDLKHGRVTTADGTPMAMVELNKADLDAWMAGRQPAPAPALRYATDDALVAEGVEGVRSHKWPNPHKAAQELAKRAQGTSEKQSIDRLGRKIRAALGKLPRNIPKHPD
jgi:hypothetical protein